MSERTHVRMFMSFMAIMQQSQVNNLFFFVFVFAIMQQLGVNNQQICEHAAVPQFCFALAMPGYQATSERNKSKCINTIWCIEKHNMMSDLFILDLLEKSREVLIFYLVIAIVSLIIERLIFYRSVTLMWRAYYR